MSAFELHSFPLEQQPDLGILEQRMGGWFVDRPYPCRFLAYSERFDMTPVRRRIERRLTSRTALAAVADQLLRSITRLVRGDGAANPAAVFAALPEAAQTQLAATFDGSDVLQAACAVGMDAPLAARQAAWGAVMEALMPVFWPIPWLHETLRQYQQLEAQDVRSATYLMLTWEPPDLTPEAITSTLRHVTGRAVEPCDQIPRVLPGPYRPEATRLVPTVPGQPYYAGLLSYDMRGVWTAQTLHTLLNADYDVAIAVDVLNLPRAKAMRVAELAHAAARGALKSTQKDTGAERRLSSAERVMHALTEYGLHQVQIAVLVSGQTPTDLENNVADATGKMGSLLSLSRVRSALVQAEIPKLWSMTAPKQISITWMRRNMLSPGVGCCMGLVGFHRARNTEGLFWGVDIQRNAPLFFDLFAKNQAAHMVILGMTGYGKTVFLNAIALRAAAQSYRVIGLDAYRNGERVERAAGAGARCYSLGLETPLNMLDVVTEDEDDDRLGAWLPRQVQIVIAQLALLLGDPGVDAVGRKQYIPRRLGTAERGVLDRALMTLYARRGTTPTTPLDRMPILSDLIAELETLREHESRALARDLRMLIFGTDDPSASEMNSLGRSFNAHTEVDWNFSLDISYYDFSRVPDEWKAFYYLCAIGAVLRWMRDPRRDRTRPTLLQLDEFGIAAQVQAVLQLAVEVTKTARKYKVGMMLIDQNPVTFLGSDNGRQIIENAASTVMFHMQDVAARQMGDAIDALTPGHVQAIIGAQPGECVAAVRKDVYRVAVQLNGREARALIGS